MPDLTLYENDASLIIAALNEKRASIYARAKTCILPEDDYEALQAFTALRDKMQDRMAQGLHPLPPTG